MIKRIAVWLAIGQALVFYATAIFYITTWCANTVFNSMQYEAGMCKEEHRVRIAELETVMGHIRETAQDRRDGEFSQAIVGQIDRVLKVKR